jgi:hypothetical protein
MVFLDIWTSFKIIGNLPTCAIPPVLVSDCYEVRTLPAVPTENIPKTNVEIRINPNQTVGLILIEGMVANSVIYITVMNGKRVKTMTCDEATVQVDMSHLSSGMYVVSVVNRATNAMYAQKILKE